MANEQNIENKTSAPAIAAVAPKAVSDAIAAPSKAAVKAKPARTQRRARKAPAKVVAAVVKNNKRAAKTVRRARNAAVAASVTPIERIKTMTNDFNSLFAGFQLPGADQFQGLFAGTGERGQQFAAKSQKSAQEFTDLAKANVEAIVEAGRIATTGAKTIGQDVLASSKQGLEQASDAVRSLAEAKSPTEFFQIQSDLARASFDRMVTESSKLTERVVKLAGEAVQPLQNRASINAERINELVA